MARLQRLKLTIKTGLHPLSGPVRIRINSHTVPMRCSAGGTRAQQTWEGELEVNSVVHSLELLGPPAGKWSVDWCHAWFVLDAGDPYGNEVGPEVLEANAATNLWSAGDTFSV